ncbi:MAG: hypothetical protein R3C26_05710 [Calditrichia bacterium]
MQFTPADRDITQISPKKGLQVYFGDLVQAQNAVPMPKTTHDGANLANACDVLPQVFNHSMQPEEGAELLSAKIDQLR